MDDAPAPDALLSQSLAVLRQCVPTLETAAARAPTVAVELRDTVAALRGVESALHQHRDALRRAEHFATLGRLAAGLSHEIRNPLGALFLHIDLLEEEFREPSAESLTVMQQTKMFQTCGSATLSESGRTINAREGSDDHPSAALPLLPRDRYCQAWAVS
jgi:signal transduction histidine kinase